MRWVRLENESHIMAVCCDRSLEESFAGAVRELINWMCDCYAFTVEEAYLLLGQVLEARCTSLSTPPAPICARWQSGI
jgi:acetamidase/formamidase